MKATELRIGNWVKGKYRDEFPANCETISDLENKSIELSAIPLTEEWLGRMGFEKGRHGRWKNKQGYSYGMDGGYPIIYFPVTGYYFKFTGKKYKLKYVHQLQNIYFALAGEELEIKEVPA